MMSHWGTVTANVPGGEPFLRVHVIRLRRRVLTSSASLCTNLPQCYALGSMHISYHPIILIWPLLISISSHCVRAYPSSNSERRRGAAMKARVWIQDNTCALIWCSSHGAHPLLPGFAQKLSVATGQTPQAAFPLNSHSNCMFAHFPRRHLPSALKQMWKNVRVLPRAFRFIPPLTARR